MICTLHQISNTDHINDETGGACSTHGRDKKCMQICGLKTSREESTWETCADEKIILKYILNKYGVKVWNGFNLLRIWFSGWII
jgi:hypothetical protein